MGDDPVILSFTFNQEWPEQQVFLKLITGESKNRYDTGYRYDYKCYAHNFGLV
jgi:hypothetical protein